MTFEKEESVRIKKLNKSLIQPYIDILDKCHRGAGKTGTISHPAYSTLNRYWFVKHDDGTLAMYHDSEIERYERPKETLELELPKSRDFSKRESVFYNPLDED